MYLLTYLLVPICAHADLEKGRTEQATDDSDDDLALYAHTSLGNTAAVPRSLASGNAMTLISKNAVHLAGHSAARATPLPPHPPTPRRSSRGGGAQSGTYRAPLSALASPSLQPPAAAMAPSVLVAAADLPLTARLVYGRLATSSDASYTGRQY